MRTILNSGSPVLEPSPRIKARAYTRLSRLFLIIQLVAGILLLSIILFSDLSIKLREFLDFSRPVAVALYVLIITVGGELLLTPLNYYREFTLPRRYGLSAQKLSSWIKDSAKENLISLTLVCGLAVLVYWLMATFPDIWWLIAGTLVALLTVVLTYLAPIVIIPQFFKCKPVHDVDFSQCLAKLAQKTRTGVCGVFTFNLSRKSPMATAMLTGLGNTRRILISSTLVQRYSPEEIEAILAHELGHHFHNDVLRLIVVQSALVFIALYLTDLVLKASVIWFGFTGVADIANLPVLVIALAVLVLLAVPLITAYSRHLEVTADSAALRLTGNTEAFITMLTKLTGQNIAEERLPRWVELLFQNHPSLNKRLDQARRYEQDRGVNY